MTSRFAGYDAAMTRRSLAVVALLLLAVRSDCLAWGGEGHQIVALIAEEHLTPEVKTAVKDLLDGGNISDAEVASWADEVRRERRETSGWHYVNIPHDAEGFDRGRDGRDGDNVIDAIERQAKVLADRTQPREKRVEALKFVVHFVGDLHQPLHCADRNGDKGGNGQLVFFLDRRGSVSLHSVWDGAILRELIGKRRISDIGQSFHNMIEVKQKAEWSKGSAEQWANESHRVAVERVYTGVTEGTVPRLGKEYVQQHAPVVAEQLMMGGVRLASVLNRALAAEQR